MPRVSVEMVLKGILGRSNLAGPLEPDVGRPVDPSPLDTGVEAEGPCRRSADSS